jgi:hypothetical protein
VSERSQRTVSTTSPDRDPGAGANGLGALDGLRVGELGVISNLRPDALDKLGLEPEATVARHPCLVYCSVSGYGLHGDDRNRPTYDIGAFWARSGLASQMADGEGNPLNARGGIGDHITGLAALSGVLGLAGAAVFLASGLSTYVTGQTLHVDGGTSAAGGWYHHPDTGDYVTGAP